jgi:hypothetical protein
MSTGRRVEADGRERAADACRSDADARERAVDVRSGHRVRGCAVDLRRSGPDVGVRAVDACGSDADVPNARAKTGRRAPPMPESIAGAAGAGARPLSPRAAS